ncbi:MAG TPA: RNA 2',3'-cyclic phosphodiesterase [Candidatus Acidoferrales bacterium]|nr:RNA 2',3'-cyclic phosphodiesterase [Candidatus Acidoferrales bacterium]
MRLFVALEIPEAIRRMLGELIAELKDTTQSARWVRSEGIHVTLKFIGETPTENVHAIQQALTKVRSNASVEVQMRGCGFFPNDRRPRVLWVGVEGSPNLAELAAAVETRLTLLGIAPESRPYRPHLTLARFQSAEGIPRLLKKLQTLEPFDCGKMRAEEFHLFQSQLQRGGARYTRLASFPFVEGAS